MIRGLNAKKAAFWTRHLGDWKASGLSQTDYCKKFNLAYKSFTRWKGVLTQTKPKSRTTRARPKSVTEGTLIPLSIFPEAGDERGLPPSSTLSGVRFMTKGYCIELSPGFDVPTLRALLKVVGSPQ